MQRIIARQSVKIDAMEEQMREKTPGAFPTSLRLVSGRRDEEVRLEPDLIRKTKARRCTHRYFGTDP